MKTKKKRAFRKKKTVVRKSARTKKHLRMRRMRRQTLRRQRGGGFFDSITNLFGNKPVPVSEPAMYNDDWVVVGESANVADASVADASVAGPSTSVAGPSASVADANVADTNVAGPSAAAELDATAELDSAAELDAAELLVSTPIKAGLSEEKINLLKQHISQFYKQCEKLKRLNEQLNGSVAPQLKVLLRTLTEQNYEEIYSSFRPLFQEFTELRKTLNKTLDEMLLLAHTPGMNYLISVLSTFKQYINSELFNFKKIINSTTDTKYTKVLNLMRSLTVCIGIINKCTSNVINGFTRFIKNALPLLNKK